MAVSQTLYVRLLLLHLGLSLKTGEQATGKVDMKWEEARINRNHKDK